MFRGNNVCVTIMKRFIVATILTALITFVLAHFMPRSFESYLGSFGADSSVTIYCRGTDLDAVDMGSGYKAECSSADFVQTVAQCRNVDGVSISFEGCLDDVAKFVRFFNLQVSSSYKQDGLYVVCGNSAKIVGGVAVGSDLVNLQIAYDNGVVHVGSPLILGDY